MSAPPLVPAKWRPSVGLIVAAVLASVMALAIAVIVWLQVTGLVTGATVMLVLGTFALALAVTAILAYVLLRTLVRPITELATRADAIGFGGRGELQPLTAYGTSETAALATSFYALSQQLLDRADYVQSIATHITHEFKSPLTAIRGAAELLRDDAKDKGMKPAERQRFLEQIMADADRLAALLSRLRQLAHAEAEDRTGSSNLKEALKPVMASFPALKFNLGTPDAQLPLNAHTAEIIFTQLITNAADHGANNVQIDANVSGQCRLTISDDGNGVPDELREQIFTPFFSTRREKGGTGLGLQIVQTLLQAHGGTIKLAESENGARFVLELPLD